MVRLIQLIDFWCDVHAALGEPKVEDDGAFSQFQFSSQEEWRKPIVGYLQAMSIDGRELMPDMEITNHPSVVGAFASIRWYGQPSDPLVFYVRVSPKNVMLVEELLGLSSGEPLIKVEWVVYRYDYDAEKYFRAFYTDHPVTFTIQEEDVYIETHPHNEVNNPINFNVFFQLRGKSCDGEDQPVCVAFNASGQSFVKYISGQRIQQTSSA